MTKFACDASSSARAIFSQVTFRASLVGFVLPSRFFSSFVCSFLTISTPNNLQTFLAFPTNHTKMISNKSLKLFLALAALTAAGAQNMTEEAAVGNATMMVMDEEAVDMMNMTAMGDMGEGAEAMDMDEMEEEDEETEEEEEKEEMEEEEEHDHEDHDHEDEDEEHEDEDEEKDSDKEEEEDLAISKTGSEAGTPDDAAKGNLRGVESSADVLSMGGLVVAFSFAAGIM